MDTGELLQELFGQLHHRLDDIEYQPQTLHNRLNAELETPTKLVKLSDAWKLLGYKNYDACLYKVRSGHYRAGKKIIDRRSPQSSRLDWYADLEKCQVRDRTLAVKHITLRSA